MAAQGRTGRPPRLSREQIVAAAQSMDLPSLTMRAVADKLGVDRKAINYYVSDRQGLLELLAAEAFQAELSQIEPLSKDADWQTTLRGFARAVHNSVVSTGALVDHLRFDEGGAHLATLRLTELCLVALEEAGFVEEEAGQALYCLSQFASGAARSEVITQAADIQYVETLQAVAEAPQEELSHLQHVLALGPVAGGRSKAFEFGLSLIIAGMEARLRDG